MWLYRCPQKHAFSAPELYAILFLDTHVLKMHPGNGTLCTYCPGTWESETNRIPCVNAKCLERNKAYKDAECQAFYLYAHKLNSKQ
uniref:MIP21525p n=1 Tax=Drosophila melanogaster TaxID=7227 RepID=D5SHT2_DROME|nr:MIP21525p [Drosophila melanogaster]